MFRFSTVFAWFTLLGYDYLCFVNMSVVVTAGLLVAWLFTRRTHTWPLFGEQLPALTGKTLPLSN